VAYNVASEILQEAVQFAHEDSRKLLVGNKADLEPRQVLIMFLPFIASL
jgi:GTPase SAR1 family protein